MKQLLAIAVTLIALSGAALPALAQEHSSVYCFKDIDYIDARGVPGGGLWAEDSKTCKFSNGRVHTFTVIGDYSESHWFTARGWKVEKARRARLEVILDKELDERRVEQDKQDKLKADQKAKFDKDHAAECEAALQKPVYARPYYCSPRTGLYMPGIATH